jgi:hypothetical protein
MRTESLAQIEQILARRRNEIAMFHEANKSGMHGSIEMALLREMKRLSALATEVWNAIPPEEIPLSDEIESSLKF